MISLQRAKEILSAHADELRLHYGTTDVAVFGSVARGEAGGRSDIDITATVAPDVSLLGIIRIENHLSEILGARVDFVPRSDIRRELRTRILAEAVSV